MLLHVIILALVLTANEAKHYGSTCTLHYRKELELECHLPTKYDRFDIETVGRPEDLEQVVKVYLTVGEKDIPYEPPINKNEITYPHWNQMRRLKQVSITFNLKADNKEPSLDLDEFQYISMDNFKGINLREFQLSSDSPKVKFQVDMLSDSNELQDLMVTGASINGQQGWNNFGKMSNLELKGEGSIDLSWLPLRTLSYLGLSLDEIKGITETAAKEMQLLTGLSLTVSNTQTQDWDFVNSLAPRLHTLKLDGFALGNFNVSTIPSTGIQHLTLSNSPNTEFINQYSFNSESYQDIELSGMKSLTFVEAWAFSGSNNLESLTITDMAVLTGLTQPLGLYVMPKFVQFTNNPNLSHVSVSIFEEIFKYDANRPTEVDVTGTEMDTTCPCEASYLAAMYKYQNIAIRSNCLEKWLEGLCTQGSCWTFMKPCNKTCQRHNAYTYTCTCQSDLVLLPDEHTCASSNSCTVIKDRDHEFNCTKYNAICYQDGVDIECHCYTGMIWDDGDQKCVTNHIIPFETTTITNIPISTNATTITYIPISTNATTITYIPISTNATTITNIPISTNATTKSYIPISTNATTISADPLGTTVRHTTNVTAKTLHSPTTYVSGKTLVPPTKVVHSVTLEPSVTNHTITPNIISTNTTNSTITPITLSVNTTHSTPTPTPTPVLGGLNTVEKSVIGVSFSIPLLVIIVIVLLVGYWCYRKKKAARRFPSRSMVSPGLLDSGGD